MLLPTDEATDDDEVGEVSNSDAAEELDEEVEEALEVDRRAKDMLASVVRPQFGSTSKARLLICVVILSRLELLLLLLLLVVVVLGLEVGLVLGAVEAVCGALVGVGCEGELGVGVGG